MGIPSYILSAIGDAMLILCVVFLPCIVFAFCMQKCSNSIRIRLASLLGIQGYIYLTAPGVVVHELSHALFCIIFGHKIAEMKLFSPCDDGTLGYVNHIYNRRNLFHRIGNFFIGTGPIWGGTAMIFLISYMLLPNNIFIFHGDTWKTLVAFFEAIFSCFLWTRWQTWIWLYLLVAIASHITLSKPDLNGAADGVIFIFVLDLILCLTLNGVCDFSRICLNGVLQMIPFIIFLFGLPLVISLFLAFTLTIVVSKRSI